MPDSALDKVPLSDTMRAAISDGKRFKRGALQRQLRRIAALMQEEDVRAITLEIQRQKQPSKQQTAELHELENWREQLIGGDRKLLSELIEQFPDIDRQHINQLIRNAKLELKRSKPPRSARLLFKYLSDIRANAKASTEVDIPAGSEPISDH